MGDEPWFIDRISLALESKVVPEESKDFNQMVLYGADTSAEQVVLTARRYPMMSEKQLVLVREAQMLSHVDELIHYVKKPLETTVLVICYKNKTLDKRKALYKELQKNAIIFESQKIPEYKLANFIELYCKSLRVTIDRKSAEMLADFLGNDLSKLTNEIEKLTLLMKDQRVITPELIEKNIGISKDYNNFELLNAIAIRDIKRVFQIADYFASNPKNNPIQPTLSILFDFFSNLQICQFSRDRSPNVLMRLLDFNQPYRLKNYNEALKRYSPIKTFQFIHKIRMTDAASKGVNSVTLPNGELLRELLSFLFL